MDVRELAADYAALVAAGKMDEAALKHWSDAIVTIEAMPGAMSETRGKDEALAKARWWYENHELHGFRSEGPFVNGDTFLIIMEIDVTPKGGQRMTMREVIGYRVADDKVVEELYYY